KGRLVRDDVSRAAAIALLGHRRPAVAQHDFAGLAVCAGEDVDLTAGEDEPGSLWRLALGQDQRPVAPRQMHGVTAAAEVAGTTIFLGARAGPLRQRSSC